MITSLHKEFGTSFAGGLQPYSGCFPCDSEIARIISKSYLSPRHQQVAAVRAGAMVCANACNEECGSFSSVRDYAYDAVAVQTGLLLEKLEAEREGWFDETITPVEVRPRN